jgi:hypothetical protein
MPCPAKGHRSIDRVDSLGLLRAAPTPPFCAASLPIPQYFVPRQSRDFCFSFPVNHAAKVARPDVSSLPSRSIP